MVSFLKEENAKENFSKWDAVILIQIIIAVAGGYFYFKSIKATTAKAVAEAEAVYNQGDYRKALKLYEAMQDLSYFTDSLDKIRYEKVSAMEEIQENEKEALETALPLLAKGDTAGVRNALKSTTRFYFVSGNDSATLTPFLAADTSVKKK